MKITDTNKVSIPTLKVEEVSNQTLGMLNNPQSTCTKKIGDYGYKFLPVVPQKFPENLDPTKLRPVKVRPVMEVSLDKVKIHPSSEVTYINKDLRSLKFVISKMGLIEPVSVVQRGEEFYVFDGISRLKVFQELGWENIMVEVFDLADDKVSDLHVIKNMKTKRSLQEQIMKAEAVLGVLGKSQGKRREQIGDLNLKDDDYGLAGKDRFQLTCALLGLDFSSSTLRKIIEIKEFEESGNEEVKGLALLDKIENKGMSISNAFNLMKNYKEAVDERAKSNPVIESLEYAENNRVKLYNKSSLDLSDQEDNSIQVAITSQPYWSMRIYPDGVSKDEIQFGREPNVDDFVKRSVEFYRGIKRVLKDEGSLFINIGEAYKNGVSSLSTHKLVVEMVNDGWFLVQTIKWKKTNAKPQGNIKRLRPVTEEIFHFVKNPTNFKYKELVFWSECENIEVQTGCNDEISGDKKVKTPKYSLKRPRISLSDFLDSQKIKGVIEGSIFNWSKLKKIDPDYIHVAPSPEYLGIIPILMTSDPGDTVLDIFNGSGTFVDTALWLGRNGVGYDTDSKSITFSYNRLLRTLKEEVPSNYLFQIENQYFLKAA